jgi:hypothetical protein
VAAEEAVSIGVLKRCTKQLVQTVVKKLKFLLYPILIDRCTAKNATKNIDPRDINPKSTYT